MEYRVFLPLLVSQNLRVCFSLFSHCFLPNHFSRLWCRINDSLLFVENLMFVWDKKRKSILDSPVVSLPSLHPSLHPFRFLLFRRETFFSRTEKKEGNYLDRKERGHLLWCLLFSYFLRTLYSGNWLISPVFDMKRSIVWPFCWSLWHPLCLLLSCLCHFRWKEACFRHFQ